MATLKELDALLGYDPDNHTVKGIPMATPAASPVASEKPLTAMPSAAATAGATAQAPAGIPQLATPSTAPASPVPAAGIPDLSKPTTAQSHAAGKAEYQEGIPQVTAAPGTVDYYTQKLEQDDYKKAHPWGSDVSAHPGVWGEIGHVAAKIGNVAGDVLDPGAMDRIPGTEAHEALEREGDVQGIKQATANELQQAEAGSWTRMVPVTDPTTGETHMVPERFAPAAINAATRVEGSERGQDIHADTAAASTAERGTAAAASTAEKATAAANADALKKPGTLVFEDHSGKPYQWQYDPSKTYSGDEGQDHWKKLGPAQPNAASLGLIGSYQALLDPNTGALTGFYNSKKPAERTDATGQPVAPGAAASGPPGTTATGARLTNTERNQFNTQYLNPANQTETQYRRATEAVDAYNSDPKTGAAGMVLFSQHLGTTLGGIKGAAIGEGSQTAHANAIGLEDRLSRFMDNLKTGQPLSANQVHDFYDLIQNTRQLQWQMTTREAARRQQSIDFLPSDVKIKMGDSKGDVREVTGDRVPALVNQGFKVQ